MRYFTLCEQAVLALSLLAIEFLLIDPFMLERAGRLSDSACDFFKFVTDLGRSHWMLFPTAVILIFAIVMRRRHGGLRNEAGYGLMISAAGFAFVSIAGAGLISVLLKNILGRARPKLFDTRWVISTFSSSPSSPTTCPFPPGTRPPSSLSPR